MVMFLYRLRVLLLIMNWSARVTSTYGGGDVAGFGAFGLFFFVEFVFGDCDEGDYVWKFGMIGVFLMVFCCGLNVLKMVFSMIRSSRFRAARVFLLVVLVIIFVVECVLCIVMRMVCLFFFLVVSWCLWMYWFMIGCVMKWRNSAMAMGGSVNVNSDLCYVIIGVNNIGIMNCCFCLFILNWSESFCKLMMILVLSVVFSFICFVASTSSSAFAVFNF